MEIYADIDQLHVFLLLLLFLLKKVSVSALSRNPQRRGNVSIAPNERCQTEIGPRSGTVDLPEQVIPISMRAVPMPDCSSTKRGLWCLGRDTIGANHANLTTTIESSTRARRLNSSGGHFH
jgi:hypothetical protein